jgi:hypothetical protein
MRFHKRAVAATVPTAEHLHFKIDARVIHETLVTHTHKLSRVESLLYHDRSTRPQFDTVTVNAIKRKVYLKLFTYVF